MFGVLFVSLFILSIMTILITMTKNKANKKAHKLLWLAQNIQMSGLNGLHYDNRSCYIAARDMYNSVPKTHLIRNTLEPEKNKLM